MRGSSGFGPGVPAAIHSARTLYPTNRHRIVCRLYGTAVVGFQQQQTAAGSVGTIRRPSALRVSARSRLHHHSRE